MAYDNKNVVADLGVILLGVSQTSTFDSPNKKYLDISDTILGVSEIRIRSVFHKQKSFVFFDFKFMKKNYSTYYTL